MEPTRTDLLTYNFQLSRIRDNKQSIVLYLIYLTQNIIEAFNL